jgi:uncharacterized glyoxalase superfamily protein PhnB
MSHKPSAHNAVSPLLLVRDAPRLLAFLAATFGAEELVRIPGPDGSVRHAEVRIDDSVLMIGERQGLSDSVVGSVHVYVPDVDHCYRSALAAGGTSINEPRDLPYGDRSAGVRDPEGNLWWLGTHLGRARAS